MLLLLFVSQPSENKCFVQVGWEAITPPGNLLFTLHFLCGHGSESGSCWLCPGEGRDHAMALGRVSWGSPACAQL